MKNYFKFDDKSCPSVLVVNFYDLLLLNLKKSNIFFIIFNYLVELEYVNSESNLWNSSFNLAFASSILYKTSIPLGLQIDQRINIPCQSEPRKSCSSVTRRIYSAGKLSLFLCYSLLNIYSFESKTQEIMIKKSLVKW